MTDPIERVKAAVADRYTIGRELGSGGMAIPFPPTSVVMHRICPVRQGE